MLHLNSSPCVFEPLPAFNVVPSIYYYPTHDERSLHKHHRTGINLKSKKESIKYEIEETDDEYVLSLSKIVPEEKVSNLVYSRLRDVRKNYSPKYRLVRDCFGNEFYIQEEKDEDALISEALAHLDMAQIGRQLAKQAFQDYEITLNHRGDELTVHSNLDRFHKEFSLGLEFEDVRVIGCEMINDSVAVLKVGIQKPLPQQPVKLIGPVTFNFKPTLEATEDTHSNCDEPERDLWTQQVEAALQEKLQQRREQQQRDLKEAHRVQKKQEMAARAEERRQQDTAIIQDQLQQKAILIERHRKLNDAKVEQERQRKLREARIAEEQEHQRLVEAAKLVEEEKRQQEAKLAEEEFQRERARWIAERKEKLVAEKRNQRLKQKQATESKPASNDESQSSSPNNVVININFGNAENQRAKTSHNKEPHPKRSRSRSPVILEDVEDEELNRYQQSLTKSPRGSSVIDDL